MANYFDLTRGQKPRIEIDRSRTVICEGEVSNWEIFDFMRRWRNPEVMQCCQKISKNLHHMTFVSRELCNELIKSGPVVKMKNKEVTIKHLEKIRKVFVKQLPSEFEKPKLFTYMSSYGRVVSVEPEYYRDDSLTGIKTGTYIVKILMKKRVPDYIYVEGYRALCHYSTMEKTCRKCGKVGHLSKSCDEMKNDSSSSKKGLSATAVIKEEPTVLTCGLAMLSTGVKPKKGKKNKKKQQNIAL